MRKRYDMLDARSLFDLQLTRNSLTKRLEMYRQLGSSEQREKLIPAIERRIRQIDKQLGGVTI